jgi:hypothetical protein
VKTHTIDRVASLELGTYGNLPNAPRSGNVTY